VQHLSRARHPNGFFGTTASHRSKAMQEFKIRISGTSTRNRQFGFPNGPRASPARVRRSPGAASASSTTAPSPRSFIFPMRSLQFQTTPQRRNVEASCCPWTRLRADRRPADVAHARDRHDTTVTARIDLLIARDERVIATLSSKGIINGEARGAVYVGNNNFQPDRNSTRDSRRRRSGTWPRQTGRSSIHLRAARLGHPHRVDRDLDGSSNAPELDRSTPPIGELPAPAHDDDHHQQHQSTSVTTTEIRGAHLRPVFHSRGRQRRPRALSHRKISYHRPPSRRAARNRIVTPGGSCATRAAAAGRHARLPTRTGRPAARRRLRARAASTGWDGGSVRAGERLLFRGTDPTGRISRITVKRLDHIRGGRRTGPTADEPSQGRVALRLKLGTVLLVRRRCRPRWGPTRVDRSTDTQKVLRSAKTRRRGVPGAEVVGRTHAGRAPSEDGYFTCLMIQRSRRGSSARAARTAASASSRVRPARSV